jgi:hypothetical protein
MLRVAVVMNFFTNARSGNLNRCDSSNSRSENEKGRVAANLAYAEGVCCVACNVLLTKDVLWTL